jgi:hypothetical protein
MNASAALVTRGVNEVQRLAINLGARSSTLTGEHVSPLSHPPLSASQKLRLSLEASIF